MAASFEWKKLSFTDRVIAVTAAVALVSLFLPWEGWSDVGASSSVTGFSTGWGLLAALLVIAAGVYIVLLRAGSTMPRTTYGPGVIVLGLSLVGTVLVILRWLTLPRASIGTLSYGPRIGMILTLIAAIVQAIFALRLFRSTGEALPWAK